jgi:beta-1,4-mannosyl-glycoprotein beta-1,4-N-acetylglucosaminyltransferase
MNRSVIVIALIVVILACMLLKPKKENMDIKKNVIDCFTFFNELDILEKRLTYMDPYVYKFILCEAPTTFTGNEKPFYFEENKDRFSKWADKIIHIKTKPLGDGFWDSEKNRHRIVDYSEEGKKSEETFKFWEREGQQRSAIEEELKKLSDDDIIIFSDVDEIPNMSKIDLNNIGDDIYVCKQQIFRYSLEYMDKIDAYHFGTFICSNKSAKKEGLVEMKYHKFDYKPIIDCGWHFTKFGGEKTALEILKSYSHANDRDGEQLYKNKLGQWGDPLIKTPQEVLDSVPKIFLV